MYVIFIMFLNVIKSFILYFSCSNLDEVLNLELNWLSLYSNSYFVLSVCSVIFIKCLIACRALIYVYCNVCRQFLVEPPRRQEGLICHCFFAWLSSFVRLWICASFDSRILLLAGRHCDVASVARNFRVRHACQVVLM